MHDWLTVYGGAEGVLSGILDCYPDADLFSIVDFLPDANRDFLKGKLVSTSFIQSLPFANRRYRSYLPLMPLAVEQFDLSSYDLIITSSHAVAKGVITGPGQLHICYCHSPMRYAWDMQHQYLRESNLLGGLKGWLAKYFLHKMRIWDLRTSFGVDFFIANSNFVARRIWKVYRRSSRVIYPPVNIEKFNIYPDKEDFYLTASRMVPYKRIDLIVEAFALMPDRQLIVIGDGPDLEKIKSRAGKNVLMMGYQQNDVLVQYMQKAKAFIFAAEEDFGIVPLEAQACGTPVIAYGKGGALETVIDSSLKRTGVFFAHQTVSSIHEAIERFEKLSVKVNPEDCRENALRFSNENFKLKFKLFINEISKKNIDEIFLK